MTDRCDSCVEVNCKPEVCKCECHKQGSDDNANASDEKNGS